MTTTPSDQVKELALQLFDAMRSAETAKRKTFGELAASWLKRLKRIPDTGNEQRHVRHLEALHDMREGELTKAAIEEQLQRLEVGFVDANGTRVKLGPASLNKVRGTGRLVIADAQANGDWKGFNPFDHVKRRRVRQRTYPRLTLEELELAMSHLREDRRRMARVSLYTGARPGELLALQKSDVDLRRGWMSIHRSHGRDETKTGVPRLIPIPAAVIDDVREAMKASPSDLVFPSATGDRQRRDTKLARILQHGLRLAGICSSWRYACRRQRGCEGFKDELETRRPGRRCPKCDAVLHEIGVPRRVTWYDLRHAASTLHREAGAEALAVKVVLGHAKRDVNDAVYTHLSDAMLVREMNKLAPPQTACTSLRRRRRGAGLVATQVSGPAARAR